MIISPMLEELTATETCEEAYTWLCAQRIKHPPNADIWSFRYHWQEHRAEIIAQLQNGNYRFEPMQLIRKHNGEQIVMWSSRDALVLKMLTRVLQTVLPISAKCTHIKGNGGAKQTVNDVYNATQHNTFVCRTDVKGYYASIDHFILMQQLSLYIKDTFMMNLLWQYCDRVTDKGGIFMVHKQGIPRGCALSPLIGAFHLTELDRQMQELGLFYRRYMDDIILLSPTRWKLRKAVKKLNTLLESLKLEKHPDKTFIGRIEKGFDFLGYQFSPHGLSVADKTVDNFVARLNRLYEQQKTKKATSEEMALVLGNYVKRWQCWCIEGMLMRPKFRPA